MEGMENVQKEKIEDGKNSPLFSVFSKHKFGKKNRFSDIASSPAQVHSHHLSES